MRKCLTVLVVGLAGLPAWAAPPATLPPPAYAFGLFARNACVTPCVRGHARADGGYIDVQTPTPNTLAVLMTGTAAANAHLGCSGSATETFSLVQEFEITCSDPNVRTVVLTLDSAVVGYVRSKHNAGACMRLANVTVTPASWDGSPLSLAHPPLCVEGTAGRSCNQHLPPLQGPIMPLGRYTMVANFVIDASAGGVFDAHAVADFSPDTALPEDWVRMRDPFQGVAKKSFGFSITLTAAPPAGPEAGPVAAKVALRPTIQRVSYTPSPTAPSRVARATGLSRTDFHYPDHR